MPIETRPAAGAFWDFCLKLYARPGVAEACLALQERFGANVPLLMCGAWLGLRQAALSEADADTLAATVGDWHREVVEPLRKIRTRLKSGPPPARSQETDALRDRVKAIELQAERIEIDHLQTLALPFAPQAELAVRPAIEANLLSILRLTGDGREAEALLKVVGDEAAHLDASASSTAPGQAIASPPR